MQFKCPVCNRICRAYVDAKLILKCPGCNTKIKPHENGRVDVVVEPLTVAPIESAKPPINKATQPKQSVTSLKTIVNDTNESNTTRASQESSSRSTADSSYSIWPMVLGALIAIGFYLWNNHLIQKGTTKQQGSYYESVQQHKAPTTSYRTPDASLPPPPNLASNESTSSKRELAYLLISNTSENAGKADKCEVSFDETTHILMLNSLDHPACTFKFIDRGGGVVTLQSFFNAKMEVESTIYRRSDLEKNDGRLIYKSSSGDSTITMY